MANSTKKEFLELTNKYLDNTASKEEIEVVEAYYDLFSVEPAVLERIAELGLDPLEKRLKDRINIKIKELEERKELPKPVIHSLWYYIARVAVILVFSSVGLYFYSNRTPQPSAMHITAENDIAPGKDKAILTLANGQKIALVDTIDGQVANEQGVVITRKESGQLIYKASTSQKTNSKLSFNTLSTPRGGQFQIQLPDGTKVWLNAASVIKFPTSFSGLAERRVELNGEAYFEVAKVNVKGQGDKAEHRLPFIVNTERQLVEVLGTHFNVNAYSDGKSVKTTLLEGAVRIIIPDLTHNSTVAVVAKSGQFILKPNEQFVLTDKGIHIDRVDAEQAIAWKDGLFTFEAENLESIMQKIAKWYDVDIHFENEELKQKIFSGSFSRFTNVSKVLQKIELTHCARFTIEGRKITVYKY
ncbi:MAG: FecR family protein [Candidatus Pedobacter colombiensis]|uniref:FecR family protein n=1 Tax=Candidatus Pedobacter colombiensis TaxID=3121371 RepID=A0AAJ5W7U1_9SPHI|nr:FecR family protein [Pedobacter sp.]WEK18584.1 MAG: FecR family protein [Pedobacter sp.]